MSKYNVTKYDIAPKEDNCVRMCLQKDYGFIRVDNTYIKESLNENIKYLLFDNKNLANAYLMDNFPNPENYIIQPNYIYDENYYNELMGKTKEIDCSNCINHEKCQRMNNSFEFCEYGNKWAQHCEDYLTT